MPRMTSNSTVSNFIRSAEVTFRQTVTGNFLYAHLPLTGSPIGVETMKGSEIVSRLTSKLTSNEIYKGKCNPWIIPLSVP